MSTETPNTTVAEIPPTQTVDTSSLLALAGIIGGSATPFYCSIDTKTDNGKSLLFHVMEAELPTVDDHLGKTIKLQHVFLASAEKVNHASSEVTALTRTVLIDVDGNAYGTFSDGLAESVRKLIGIYGLPPWKMGLEVTLSKRKTGSGFTMFYLAPVLNSTPKPTPTPATKK